VRHNPSLTSSNLGQEFIIEYIETIDWHDRFIIIMELVEHGDLGDLVERDPQQRLQESDGKIIGSQILSAVKYLHGKNITHRDIKPDNILVKSENPLIVKLTDFGLSKVIENDETFLKTFCGTLLYCAPEIYPEYNNFLRNPDQARSRRGQRPLKRYDQSCDLWSFAGVLFYILSANPPYPAPREEHNAHGLLKKIMTEALDLRPLQRVGISEDCIDFIKSMLRIYPADRPSIDELETHRWFTGGAGDFSFVSTEMEYDEVDQVNLNTSQLSLQDGYDEELGTSDEVDLIGAYNPRAGTTPIPQNYESIDGYGYKNRDNRDEADGYHAAGETLKVNNGNRLFGEVPPSLLGSSGVLPNTSVIRNLEYSASVYSNSDSDSNVTGNLNTDSQFSAGYDSNHARAFNLNKQIDSSVQPSIEIRMPEPNDAPSPMPTHGVAAPSLMGMESYIDNLAVDSAAATMNAPSPTVATNDAPSPQPGPIDIESSDYNLGGSIRSPTESMMDALRDVNEYGQHQSKRARPNREIDMEVSQSTFWNPRDRSTHHINYPKVMSSVYREAKRKAEARGERFEHGNPIFDELVGGTVRAESASSTPDPLPVRKGSGHSMATIDGEGKVTHLVHVGNKMVLESEAKSTAYRTPVGGRPAMSMIQTPARKTSGPVSLAQTAAINRAKSMHGDVEFVTPPRIIAKFTTTPDSILQGITLHVDSILTTWGRASENTMRYPDLNQIKVPKYGMKVVAYSPTNPKPTSIPREQDNDFAFYIATKSSNGIRVNGFHLGHFQKEKPFDKCKLWGKLHNGDIIDVWRNPIDPKENTRFRFECSWGASREPRKEKFNVVPEGELQCALDKACMRIELKLINDIREKREKEAARLGGKKRKLEEESQELAETMKENVEMGGSVVVSKQGAESDVAK
jgi:serine/threonine protein kinase